MAKIPFLDKLTGAIGNDDYDDLFENDEPTKVQQSVDDDLKVSQYNSNDEQKNNHINTEDGLEAMDGKVGELSVDVYQTENEIVIRALVAGVSPANLDISLTRDMITVKGTREEAKEVEGDDYFYQELYWGSFARTILLPEEVEVDEAVATENHGILIIRLPKINKARKTKLKVKSK